MEVYILTKTDFKNFVRRHPNLVNYVNNGKMTWQKFYELYDIYGEDNTIWNQYDSNIISENKTTTVGDTSIKDLFNMVKKIDLESVRKGAEGLQKAITLFQDFSKPSAPAPSYQARPLYQHFED